jgi:uncharacterized protein YbjT (DUF2867 family)
MKVLLFGATGMVGQGVLRECLLDPDVEAVVSVGRAAIQGVATIGSVGAKPLPENPKLREVVRADLADVAGYAADLAGHDACFFCLGVSSAGMTEEAYTRITYDLTLAVAEAFAKASPGATFVYVSGEGTDGTERGRSMWARVKGRTENALLKLPLKAFMFRPGLIQPLHGIKSKTGLYQAVYTVTGPLLPLLKRVAPKHVTTTEQVGRAMLVVAKRGADKRVLETPDINAL